MLTGFSMPSNGNDTTCDAPTNVTVTAKFSSSISFDWDGPDGSTYEVYYVRQSDGYTSPVYSTSSSDYAYSGLSAGTYDFYFRTDCGTEMSEIIGIEEVFIG